jgi:hypothetical protein
MLNHILPLFFLTVVITPPHDSPTANDSMAPTSPALLGLVHSGDCIFDGRTYSHGSERTDTNGRIWQCWNGQWLAAAPGPIQVSLRETVTR